MIRYADPEVCPCCRMQIPYAAPQCPHCGAVLTGPVAQGLFRTLTHADTLVAQLTAPAPVAAGVGAPPRPRRPFRPAARGWTRRTRASRRRPRPSGGDGLSAASVPRILLGLGATCLLVAAVVFLAVAWSDLGMGARTAILLTLTAGAAAATGWMGRRGAARRRGGVRRGVPRLPDPGRVRRPGRRLVRRARGRGFLVLLGSVLTVAALGTAAGVTRTGMRPLVGAQLVVAAGAMAVAAGVTTMADGQNAAVLVAIVLGSAALARAAHLLHLRVAAVATGAVAGLWWLTLVGLGLDRVGSEPTPRRGLGRPRRLAAAGRRGPRRRPRAAPLAAAAGPGHRRERRGRPAHRRRRGTGRGRVHPDPGPRRARPSSPPAPPCRWPPPAPGAGSRSSRPSPRASGSPPRSRSWAARPSRPSSTTGSGRSTPRSTCSPPPSRATGRCCSR